MRLALADVKGIPRQRFVPGARAAEETPHQLDFGHRHVDGRPRDEVPERRIVEPSLQGNREPLRWIVADAAEGDVRPQDALLDGQIQRPQGVAEVAVERDESLRLSRQSEPDDPRASLVWEDAETVGP